MARIYTPDLELAALVEQVLARSDAYDALEYVLDTPIGGPSCGCGADHWSCDYDPEDDSDDEELPYRDDAFPYGCPRCEVNMASAHDIREHIVNTH